MSKSWAVPPPSERCTGTVTETRRITASFGVAPVRSRAMPPDRRFGWLHFKARLTSPRYSHRLDTSGAWGIDLGEPDAPPPEPGECEFTHEHKNLKCRWLTGATRRPGVWFMLVPVDGRYNLVVSTVSASLLSCERHEGLQLIELGPPRTKLRRAAVARLRPGKRVRVSGTIVTPYDYDNDELGEHHRGQ